MRELSLLGSIGEAKTAVAPRVVRALAPCARSRSDRARDHCARAQVSRRRAGTGPQAEGGGARPRGRDATAAGPRSRTTASTGPASVRRRRKVRAALGPATSLAGEPPTSSTIRSRSSSEAVSINGRGRSQPARWRSREPVGAPVVEARGMRLATSRERAGTRRDSRESARQIVSTAVRRPLHRRPNASGGNPTKCRTRRTLLTQIGRCQGASGRPDAGLAAAGFRNPSRSTDATGLRSPDRPHPRHTGAPIRRSGRGPRTRQLAPTPIPRAARPRLAALRGRPRCDPGCLPGLCGCAGRGRRVDGGSALELTPTGRHGRDVDRADPPRAAPAEAESAHPTRTPQQRLRRRVAPGFGRCPGPRHRDSSSWCRGSSTTPP